MKEIIRKLRKRPFVAFACRKFVLALVAMFLAWTILFVFMRLMPSDPATLMAGKLGTTPGMLAGASPTGGISSGVFEAMKAHYIEKFGVGKPILEQYILSWGRFFTMDFGSSYFQYPTKVSSLVAYALPWTMALVLPIIPIGFVIGNWIGSRAAYYRGRFDRFMYYISMYLAWTPYFWFALILMFIFGIQLGWFPVHGAFSTMNWIKPTFSIDWFLSALQHYTLPFLSLLGLGIGGWAIGMRAMVIYEMESDYMQYSKQLGFTKGKLREYSERNAILPNFTSIPLMLNMLISSTLIVEVVFGYPGLGYLAWRGITQQDFPVAEACFLLTLLIVIVGNYMADLLYGKLDPRIAAGYVGEK